MSYGFDLDDLKRQSWDKTQQAKTKTSPKPPPAPKVPPTPKAPPEPVVPPETRVKATPEPKPAPSTYQEKKPVEPGLGHSHKGSGSTMAESGINGRLLESTQFWHTLADVFVPRGGDVIYNKKHETASISGMSVGLIQTVQQALIAKYDGVSVLFPWGRYTLSRDNKVFQARTSLVRYLLYQALPAPREGSVLDYPLQAALTSFPSLYDKTFNPGLLTSRQDDAFDMYVLTLAVYMEADATTKPVVETPKEVMQRLDYLTQVIQKQQKMLGLYMDQHYLLDALQTMDTFGLLRGNLPQDVDGVPYYLEQNRQGIKSMNDALVHHTQAERERQQTMLRDKRARAYGQKKG